MTPRPEEWLLQADYDLSTAEYMFKGGRLFYAVFMCQLSLEKALKGLYQMKLNTAPPRIHNLIYLMTKLGLKPSDTIGRFLVKLNEAGVANRYPEDLRRIEKEYSPAIVSATLDQAKESLEWIRKQY
ncbi:MAG: HEPN domain-containing protein [Deltaproteobacteria bacterium]|nr:HEPN domain-containing protein [Deltaproteobacteria bacterium]MBF0527413.1 HEPN domain-containing protein [Deltaproteobacteria bacterium]